MFLFVLINNRQHHTFNSDVCQYRNTCKSPQSNEDERNNHWARSFCLQSISFMTMYKCCTRSLSTWPNVEERHSFPRQVNNRCFIWNFFSRRNRVQRASVVRSEKSTKDRIVLASRWDECHPSRGHRALPGDEFFFTQFFIAAQIQLSDDFFSTFLRRGIIFSIRNTRTIILWSEVNLRRTWREKFLSRWQWWHWPILSGRVVHHQTHPTWINKAKHCQDSRTCSHTCRKWKKDEMPNPSFDWSTRRQRGTRWSQLFHSDSHRSCRKCF